MNRKLSEPKATTITSESYTYYDPWSARYHTTDIAQFSTADCPMPPYSAIPLEVPGLHQYLMPAFIRYHDNSLGYQKLYIGNALLHTITHQGCLFLEHQIKVYTRMSHVLFIVCDSLQKYLESPNMRTLLDRFRKDEIVYSVLPWNSPTLLNADNLLVYTHITFYASEFYYKDIQLFHRTINQCIIPAQLKNPDLQVINDPRLVLWNSDKVYLFDLQTSGIKISPTELLTPVKSEILAKLATKQGKVILKPSVSADGDLTHLVNDAQVLSKADHQFIDLYLSVGRKASLLAQDYESEISNGELSIIYIDGHITHSILKTPAEGEFSTSVRHGARRTPLKLENLPVQALETVGTIVPWLEARFGKLGYVRIDGIPRNDGSFVLMEVEAIEPILGFHEATLSNTEPEDGLEAFAGLFKLKAIPQQPTAAHSISMHPAKSVDHSEMSRQDGWKGFHELSVQ